ncbi:unnamed protein product [Pylaiella littoralis]
MDESAIRQGVYVTAAYTLVFYGCIIGQARAKVTTAASYTDGGERFERYYNVKDKAMLAWDRIVGNLLEQAMPFLTLFWLNIGLAALGLTGYTGVAVAGWIYVVFRALYPVSDPHVFTWSTGNQVGNTCLHRVAQRWRRKGGAPRQDSDGNSRHVSGGDIPLGQHARCCSAEVKIYGVYILRETRTRY